MKVGDIVFATLKSNNKLWPGKLQHLSVMAEVKFFRVKAPEKLPIKDVHPYSQQLAEKAQAANPEKMLATAIKMAEKALQAQMQAVIKAKVVDVDVDANEGRTHVNPNQSRQNISLLPIKEEEDNCKLQEEEEREKGPLPYFPNLLQFLLSQPIQVLIQDATKNNKKQYIYFSCQTRQATTTHQYPKYILMCLLQQLLHLSCSEKNSKQRSLHQKKVIRVLNSGVVGVDDALASKVMMWSDYCLRGLRGRENCRADEMFVNVVNEFRKGMLHRFEEHLDDYTEVSHVAKTLNHIFDILKQ